MMKLYYAPGACSLAPHIAAHEAGLDIVLEKVDLAAKRTESGADYLAINPKGSVPALELEGGEVLTEVAVLLQYIAAQAPAANLAPIEGMARWQFLETLNYIATEVHKGFGPLWNPALSPDAKAIGLANLKKKFDYLNTVLATRSYLTGEGFTVADAYAFTVLNWTRFHAIDLAPWPSIQAFRKRISERPAVQQALRHEGLA